MKKAFTAALMILASITLSWATEAEDLVQVEVISTTLDVPGGNASAVIGLKVMDRWHINSHSPFDEFVIPTDLAIEETAQCNVKEIRYPDGQIRDLAALGGKSSVYEGQVRIAVDFTLIGKLPDDGIAVRGKVSYQGCNDQVCLAPAEKAFTIHLNGGAVGETIAPDTNHETDAKAGVSGSSAQQGSISDSIARKGFVLTLLIIFLGGLALNLTPCVYPLIPITMGFFSSQGKKGSSLLMASMYVVGIAVTYSALGTFAALTGSMFGTALTNPVVLIIMALIMVGLSLSMFGVYEFRLPTALMQLGGGARNGAVGSLIMGLTMGIVAAPCVGPFVIGLLTYVAQTGSPLIGFIMFFTLSLGLGLPYLFLGLFSSRLSALPRSGEWLNGVRIFFGLTLVGMALYFLNPLIHGKAGEYMIPVYMILAAVYYAVFDKSGMKSPGFLRGKIFIAMVILALGIWMIKPAPQSSETLAWESWSEEALQTADVKDQPVLIDFFADWCIPCKELDKLTFSDPQVAESLKNYTLLKVDLTQDKSEWAMKLKQRYGIQGVPTVIFLDEDGTEYSAKRLTGFEKPEQFLRRLK